MATKRWTTRDTILDEMEIVLADLFITIGHYCAVAWLRSEMLRRMRENAKN